MVWLKLPATSEGAIPFLLKKETGKVSTSQENNDLPIGGGRECVSTPVTKITKSESVAAGFCGTISNDAGLHYNLSCRNASG